MQITHAHIQHMRSVRDARLLPHPRLNVITGDNGAGKTTVLEALHLMAHGRSFRGRVRDGLVQRGAPALQVFLEWTDADASGDTRRRAGLRHTGNEWQGRLDGADVQHLGEFCAALAVVSFDPGSHALITGGGEIRRRFLDWGLFHVEPDFLGLWRRYARAHRQRNALLKSRAGIAQLDAWDRELAEAGEPLTRKRAAYLARLAPVVAELAATIAPTLGPATLEYQPGWRADDMPLLDALLVSRDKDLQVGHGTVGPQRADWRMNLAAVPGRDALSRGQAKLAALAALLGQARLHATAAGEWPVVCLDDIGSELDRNHRQRVFDWLAGVPAQVFLTGTEAPSGLPVSAGAALFHVEHGVVIHSSE